jgi:CheY-like chemotaxis protein
MRAREGSQEGVARPVIVHVEDDPDLASLLHAAFERFGFRGTMRAFATVRDAIECLDAAAMRREPVDLIITDMRLPDGLGLDVVRHARRSPATSKTPILVLSSELDPKNIESAYSLGANTFLAKSGSKRSISEVVRTLYEHWVEDARLPPPKRGDRLQDLLARFVAGRGRYADFCLRMANDVCGKDGAELGFWFAAALREANLANLLSFLGNMTEADLPMELLAALEQLEATLERDLDELEDTMRRTPIVSREDAYRCALALERGVDVGTIARAIAHVMPAAPVPMAALRDLVSGNLRALGAWIGTHAEDSTTRERAAQVERQGSRLEDLVRAGIATSQRRTPLRAGD